MEIHRFDGTKVSKLTVCRFVRVRVCVIEGGCKFKCDCDVRDC